MLNLKNCTFAIPFFPDSEERIENIKCILRFLTDNFDTRILVVEQNSQPTDSVMFFGNGVKYQLIKAEVGEGFIFHRTRIINEGIKRVSTPYFCNYDTDVIFQPQQLVRSVELLHEGAQVVYPYSGDFVDIERDDYLKNGTIRERESFAVDSKGGAVFMNTKDYVAAGMENEFLYGHAPEDMERWHRLSTLGYRIARTEGKCWHIMHERGAQNPHNEKNMAEFEKVKAMGKEELMEYIKTWKW